MARPGSGRKPEDLFDARPRTLKLFNLVREYIESLGAVTIETKKTQVSFGIVRKFVWVWLPQIWIRKQPPDSITLTFAADHPVYHLRIREKVEPRPGYWTHHIVIESEADFNDDVREWLREARVYGERPGKSTR